MGDPPRDDHPPGLLGRVLGGTVGAVRGAVDAGVASQARSTVDDLEPYLTEETIPRVVEALLPDLIERIVPAVVDGVTPHLAEVTVPDVVRGATPVLADEVIPGIVERLRPYLEKELVPAIVDALVPHLVEVTVPEILRGLTPELSDDIVPAIVERLRPYLEQHLVPAVIDAVTPHIVETTAPAILAGIMPLIRAEVVPQVLEDVADDPRIRALVREQSLGLVIDAFEGVRHVLVGLDTRLERVGRAVLGGRAVTDPVGTVLPPRRPRAYAGLATRAAGSGIDLALMSFLAAQGLAATLGVLGVVLDPIPTWVTAAASGFFAALAPLYLAVCWRVAGRTIGNGLAGYAVVGLDGSHLGSGRALARALLSLVFIPVWAAGTLLGVRDPRRRGLLDRLTGSATPYRFHGSRVG